MSKIMEAVKGAQQFGSVALICEWEKPTIVIPRDHILPKFGTREQRESSLTIDGQQVAGRFIFYLGEFAKIEFINKDHLVLVEEGEKLDGSCKEIHQFVDLGCITEDEVPVTRRIGHWYRKSTTYVKLIELDVKSSFEKPRIVCGEIKHHTNAYGARSSWIGYFFEAKKREVTYSLFGRSYAFSQLDVEFSLGTAEIPVIGDPEKEVRVLVKVDGKFFPIRMRMENGQLMLAKSIAYETHLGKFYRDAEESSDGMRMIPGGSEVHTVVDKEEYGSFEPTTVEEVERMFGKSLYELVGESQALAWTLSTQEKIDAWYETVRQLVEGVVRSRETELIDAIAGSPLEEYPISGWNMKIRATHVGAYLQGR